VLWGQEVAKFRRKRGRKVVVSLSKFVPLLPLGN